MHAIRQSSSHCCRQSYQITARRRFLEQVTSSLHLNRHPSCSSIHLSHVSLSSTIGIHDHSILDGSAHSNGPVHPILPANHLQGFASVGQGPDVLAQVKSNARSPEPEHTQGPEQSDRISDQEWEIRTGRAIYILQQTLPDFFETGLVSSAEIPLLNPSTKKEVKPDVESIYSPKIRLAYTPPVALPPPFPRTLHVEGLPLYMASSAFVRHTLKALYTDLHVELRRVRVHGPKSNGSGPSPSPGVDGGSGGIAQHSSEHRNSREKSLFIGLAASGIARVSGARGGWEVNSTYTFSPLTGLIQLHSIDSIEPAPHQSVFDALRVALIKIGFGGRGRESPGAGAARSQGVPQSGVKSG